MEYDPENADAYGKIELDIASLLSDVELCMYIQSIPIPQQIAHDARCVQMLLISTLCVKSRKTVLCAKAIDFISHYMIEMGYGNYINWFNLHRQRVKFPFS
jgi:hypothetical protein